MKHVEKNGIFIALVLCVFLLPLFALALEPNPEGKTAGERLEEIREVDSDVSECQLAAGNESGNINDSGYGSGDYVPVHEVGDLFSVTTQNAGLTFQICMYTKALKRIQYEWEEKELITNPDARKASAVAIGELRKEYFYGEDSSSPGIAQKQFYTTKDEETGKKGQPIYITNTAQHLQQVDTEVQGLFLKDIEDAQPIFAQTIKRSLAEDSAVNQSEAVRLKQRLTSDFVEQEFTDFTSDFNKGGWDAWLKIIQPKNNPYGQYLIAQEELSVRKVQAEENAREEILAGGGFLPNRVCEQWDSLPNTDLSGQTQFCRRWKTLTPAGAQSNQYTRLWGATLDQTINADEQIEDFIKDELDYDRERLEIGIAANTSPGSIFDNEEQDPCPGPGPCVSTGWTGVSTLPQSGGGTRPPTGGGGDLTDNRGETGIPDFLDDNPDIYPGWQDFLDDLLGRVQDERERLAEVQRFLTTVPPVINMTVSTPTLQEIQTVPNQSRITWDTFNAKRCEVANDWYDYGTRNANDYWEGTYTVKRKGDALQPTGSNRAVTIKHPIRFPVDFINTESGDPSNTNNQYLQTSRAMISSSVDPFRLVETLSINLVDARNFIARQPHDLLIGGLDGRWDRTTQRATGERPAIHVPQADRNACGNDGWFGPSKLARALQNEIARRISLAGDPAENVLRYFSISYSPNDVCQRNQGSRTDNPGWNSASISITPQLRYGMICYNNNEAPNNYTYKEITITR